MAGLRRPPARPGRANAEVPRPEGLSAEDRALWEQVASSARPLAPRPARPQPEAPVQAPSHAAGLAQGARATASPALVAPEPRRVVKPEGRPAPPVAWRRGPENDRPAPVRPGTPGLDRNTARRLAQGRRAPEARLDLHGMTADAAHAALTRFVFESVALGRRCVLVVTGKGWCPHGGGRGAGVLRRDAPRWLGVPPLAAEVVGVFEAHARHGGGGALYVYLRRRR